MTYSHTVLLTWSVPFFCGPSAVGRGQGHIKNMFWTHRMSRSVLTYCANSKSRNCHKNNSNASNSSVRWAADERDLLLEGVSHPTTPMGQSWGDPLLIITSDTVKAIRKKIMGVYANQIQSSLMTVSLKHHLTDLMAFIPYQLSFLMSVTIHSVSNCSMVVCDGWCGTSK